MMRSGDGFESSYVSIESEIGFLWKGCLKIKCRQSGRRNQESNHKHVLLRWPKEPDPKE